MAEDSDPDKTVRREVRKDMRQSVNREFASVEEFILEYVSNLSQSGAFIRTDDPLPVGTDVALRFSLILEEIETIEGNGRVVRVVPPGGAEPPGMGVVFTELTAHSQKLIERLLTRAGD